MKYTLLLLTMMGLVLNANSQNVGINNPAPNTTLDVNGALALREAAISMANGDNNNVVIGERSFFRITGPTAAFAITGLFAAAGNCLFFAAAGCCRCLVSDQQQ